MDEDVKNYIDSRASFSIDYTGPFSQNQVSELEAGSEALGFESQILNAGLIQLTQEGTFCVSCE